MEKKKKTKTRTKTGTKAKRSRARKKKTVWKKAVAAAAVLLVLLGLVAAYVWRAGYFSEYFYKGTWINGNDCTYLTKGQVKQILQEKVSEYTLTVTAQEGDSYTITGPQLHLAYVDDRYVDQLLENQEPLKWIRKDFEERSYEIPVNTDYDRNAAETLLRSFPFLKAENIISPQNAYIQEIEDGYSIVPEVVGNAPDEEKVMNLVHEAIQTGKKQVSLAEGGCYQKPDVYRDDEKLVETVNILNHLTEANLTYQVCGETFTIDRALLKSWLIHDEQGAYAIDSEKIEAFINGLADKRDSYGGKRKFKTYAGKEITLTTNQYGWIVNRKKSTEELKNALAEGRQDELELVYDRKAWGKGANDLGSVYVEISIDAQTMWCYKDGKVVVETPVVTGNMSIPGRATPRNGCWMIYKKATEYTMRGPIQENGQPEYTAFVHYWMPFNGGVGIHDLASRGDQFGGDIYLTNGSHGCINTPYDAVKKIFETVKVGTPVIVY